MRSNEQKQNDPALITKELNLGSFPPTHHDHSVPYLAQTEYGVLITVVDDWNIFHQIYEMSSRIITEMLNVRKVKERTSSPKSLSLLHQLILILACSRTSRNYGCIFSEGSHFLTRFRFIWFNLFAVHHHLWCSLGLESRQVVRQRVFLDTLSVKTWRNKREISK